MKNTIISIITTGLWYLVGRYLFHTQLHYFEIIVIYYLVNISANIYEMNERY